MVRRIDVREFDREGWSATPKYGIKNYLDEYDASSPVGWVGPPDDPDDSQAETRFARSLDNYDTRAKTDRLVDVKTGNVINHHIDSKEGFQSHYKLITGENYSGDDGLVHLSGKRMQKTAYGRQNLILSHPFSPTGPATIDFSKITSTSQRTLELDFHAIPAQEGIQLKVRVDDKIAQDWNINAQEGWVHKSIPFRNNRVVIEHHAIGWYFEYLLFDYRITPRTK